MIITTCMKITNHVLNSLETKNMKAHRSKRKLFVLEMYLLGRDVVAVEFSYLFIMFSPKEKIIPFISLFRSQKKQNKTVTCQLRVLCALCVVTTLIIVVVCGFLVAAFVKPSTFSFVSSLIGLNTVCQDLPGKLMFIK